MISATASPCSSAQKPLFENVSSKFGKEGNRYGLIGANGSGKSTFMKILGGDLEQTASEVAIENGVRLGKLRQDPVCLRRHARAGRGDDGAYRNVGGDDRT